MPVRIVLSPAPGLGDFIVRLPALRLLSAASREVHYLVSLPVTYEPLVKRLLPETNVRMHFASSSYRKSVSHRVREHLGDLSAALQLRQLSADSLILLVDDNSRLSLIHI